MLANAQFSLLKRAKTSRFWKNWRGKKLFEEKVQEERLDGKWLLEKKRSTK
jgi:hypothetical protein